MGDFSLILFARPSMAEGIGRLMDFGNTMSEYNGSPYSDMADNYAMQADSLALGDDMRAAFIEVVGVKQVGQEG